MNVLLQHSKQFLKRNASTILTTIGGIGVVTTTIMAVKATPKAMKLIDNAKQEKGEELTTFEVVKTAAPAYIPTALTGTATIACIFGANALNKRQQASLMSAYALLDSSYKDYKNKVAELYGEDADGRVREELAKDKYEDAEISVKDDNNILFYDEYSEQYFETTMEKVLKAEYLLNRNANYHGYACLNEFYDLLGLPEQSYGDILGWNLYEIGEWQTYTWIEFNHRKVTMDDGLECYILEIATDPIPNFEDY